MGAARRTRPLGSGWRRRRFIERRRDACGGRRHLAARRTHLQLAHVNRAQRPVRAPRAGGGVQSWPIITANCWRHNCASAADGRFPMRPLQPPPIRVRPAQVSSARPGRLAVVEARSMAADLGASPILDEPNGGGAAAVRPALASSLRPGCAGPSLLLFNQMQTHPLAVVAASLGSVLRPTGARVVRLCVLALIKLVVVDVFVVVTVVVRRRAIGRIRSRSAPRPGQRLALCKRRLLSRRPSGSSRAHPIPTCRCP
jgi:hypothetical protein